MESAKLRKGGTVREFVVWAEVNLAVVLAIRDHHGHPDYLADGINGDRLQVYDGLHSARFGNAKRSLALCMNNNSDKTKVGSVCSAQINV